MAIDGKITDEKLQHGIIKEAAKISTLSSRKIDKCEYLKGEKILPPDQRRVILKIEQAKLTYSPLEKAFKKQTKRIEDKGEKQIKVTEENKKTTI